MKKYEFTNKEKALFTEFYGYMLIASMLFFIIGGVALIRSIFMDGNAFFIIFGLSMLVLGIAFFIPTDNFRNITYTEGPDIATLMQAFAEIRIIWGILVVVLVIHRLNVMIQFIF